VVKLSSLAPTVEIWIHLGGLRILLAMDETAFLDGLMPVGVPNFIFDTFGAIKYVM